MEEAQGLEDRQAAKRISGSWVFSMPLTLARFYKTHAFILPSSLIVLCVFTWFITYGTWRLFVPEDEQSSFADLFYDAQAISLLNGRLDVPPEAIGFEAFVYKGKYYGYFGIVPALLRLPVLGLFPGMEGRCNRVLMVIACAGTIWAIHLLIRLIRLLFQTSTEVSGYEKIIYSLFVLLGGLGSTHIFLASRSFVYHEAIIWGAVFALYFYYYYLLFLIYSQTKHLILAGIFSILTFHCRATFGAGAMVSLGCLVFLNLILGFCNWRLPPSMQRLQAIPRYFGFPPQTNKLLNSFIAVVFIGITVGCYFLINYAKFETINGMPLDRYIRFDYFDQPKNLKLIQGQMFHISNFRMCCFNLFSPTSIEFSEFFPWVYMAKDPVVYPESKLENWDDFSSLTAGMPALFLFSLLGLAAGFLDRSLGRKKKLRLPILGAFAGALLQLFFCSLAERYVHEFYPLIILAGVAGLEKIMTMRNWKLRSFSFAIILPFVAFSIYANWAFTLYYQRNNLVHQGYLNKWSGEKSIEFQKWCIEIDRYFLGNIGNHEIMILHPDLPIED
jgi:hypothetical protein